MIFFKNLLVVGSLLVALVAHAQEPIAGLIPRFYSIEAATDLPIPPEEAHERALHGFDLSTLDPKADSNLWTPTDKGIPQTALIAPGTLLEFVQTLPSRPGQVRFTVSTPDHREFNIVIAKKVHTNLLRRNLLAKLGYNTQPMSWLSNFQLSFRDTVDRDLLKDEMSDKLLAGTDRWIKAQNGLVFDMQDVLVLSPEADIYNLASGVMPANLHMGRRVLRSVFVPLCLVDATESINLMPWLAGRVVLNNIKLDHTQDLDNTYRTSWEDARWIGRRMARLTRADWEEIVRQSKYPAPVEKLMVEKIISRRNDLMGMLDLTKEGFKDIAFDTKVTLGTALVDGEITQEFFPGYAGRFSYGDPESPFSASELGSFALSRAQSTLIDLGIQRLNKYLGTDEDSTLQNKLKDIITQQGLFYPLQAIVVPTYHGNVILSRDIVTGTYLGTNNKVQLVDNIGYSLDAGVVAGIVGLPVDVPVNLKAGGQVSFQRVYSHIKPVETLKKSLKEPYRNMFVPMALKTLGHKIDRLTTAEGPEQQVLMTSIVNDIKKTLQVGESFIITDSLVPTIFAEGQVSVSQIMGLDKNLLKAYGRVQTDRMILTRFHLHRPSEDTIQVYQDYGKNLKLTIVFKLKSYIPIIGFNGRWNTATAETRFFPISIANKDLNVPMLKALRQSIFALNHEALEKVITPHHIDHVIKGAANTLEFLIWKRTSIGSDQSMGLRHALGGSQRMIYRRYDAVTTGVDYEDFSVDTVNDLISAMTSSDISIGSVQSLNPGFTFEGKAKNKIFTSEADGGRITTQFQRIINGWKIKPNKMRSVLEQLNRESGRSIFDPRTVTNTNSILLYQISFQYILAQEGTNRLTAASAAQFADILKRFPLSTMDENDIASIASRYASRFKKIGGEIRLADPTDGLKHYHDALKDLQGDITIRGLEELVGKDNIAYQGRIEGFRQGDENGDSAIFTNVYGELPLPLGTMPTQQVMSNWGILEGELLANWMLERAI